MKGQIYAYVQTASNSCVGSKYRPESWPQFLPENLKSIELSLRSPDSGQEGEEMNMGKGHVSHVSCHSHVLPIQHLLTGKMYPFLRGGRDNREGVVTSNYSWVIAFGLWTVQDGTSPLRPTFHRLLSDTERYYRFTAPRSAQHSRYIKRTKRHHCAGV